MPEAMISPSPRKHSASATAQMSPKVVITDGGLYDEQQLRQVLGAALRGAGLALCAGRLTLPLVTQLPPSLSAFDAKWRGIFTSAGYAAEGARITRREWMRFYTEADLVFESQPPSAQRAFAPPRPRSSLRHRHGVQRHLGRVHGVRGLLPHAKLARWK